MKPTYFIRQVIGGVCREVWYGPYDTLPKKKFKALTEQNDSADYYLYKCKEIIPPEEWQ